MKHNILLLLFLVAFGGHTQNTPAGKTYHARTSVDYEKPLEYYVLSFGKDSVEAWEHKVKVLYPGKTEPVNKKTYKWRLEKNRVRISGLSEKGLYLNGDELQGMIDGYPKGNLMFKEQPHPQGRYLMQLGSTCIRMVDGGCSLTDFRALEFRADSVDIWYYTEASCVPSSRERAYNNTQSRKTYAWTVYDSKVMIAEQQFLTFSARELREMENYTQQYRKQHYLVRYPATDSDVMQLMHGGYLDQDGDTVVPVGVYTYCESDTIRNFGIVKDKNGRYLALDNHARILFSVYEAEYGMADRFSEGLIRVYDGELHPPLSKVGYADTLGNMVIEPQFALAEPFHKGRARVTNTYDGPNGMATPYFKGKDWFFIDRRGQIVKP